jgi:hypothetical protein
VWDLSRACLDGRLVCLGIPNEGGELGRAKVCYGEQMAGRELLGGCGGRGVAAGLHSRDASQGSSGGGAEGEHCGLEWHERGRLGESNCKLMGCRRGVYCGECALY